MLPTIAKKEKSQIMEVLSTQALIWEPTEILPL